MIECKLKRKILVPLLISLVLILGAFIWSVYVSNKNEIARDLENHLESVQELYEKQLSSDAELMGGVIDMLSRNKKIQTAWMAKDRTALLELTSPLLSDLRKNYRITHFYFYDLNLATFLRVYNPKRYGDITKHATALKAQKSGQLSSGIEIGSLGSFTLRVVHPWRIDGQVVGYIELGEEIEHIIEQLSSILGVELYVSIYKKYLDRKEWEKGMRILGHEGKWDRLTESVIVGQTLKVIPDIFKDFLNHGNHEYMNMSFDIRLPMTEQIYHLGVIPLFDVRNREVGDMVVLYDGAKLQASARRSIIINSVVSFIIGGVLFMLFSIILGRIESDLIARREQLEQVLEEYSATNENLKQEIGERIQIEETLQKSEEQTRLIVETALDAVISMDGHGLITGWNSQAESMFGWHRSEVTGQNLSSTIIPSQYLDAHNRGVKHFLDIGKETVFNKRLELVALHRDGHEFPIELSVSPPVRVKGSYVLNAFIRDISERKQAETDLKRKHMVQNVLNNILSIHLKTSSLEEMLDCALEQILSIHWFASKSMGAIFLVEDNHDELVLKSSHNYAARLLTKCGQVPFNKWLCEKAVTTKDIQLNDCIDECSEPGVEGTSPHGLYCIPIISSSKVLGVLTLCVKEDHQPKQEKIDFLRGISNILAGIIERRQLEVKLDNLAHFDVLTNIPNRNMFSVSMTQLLALAKRNNKKLSLLFLDLDGFKAVNDSYGHDVGDLLLKEVSKKFKSCLRSSDLIIRMGGDEFTIILSEIVDEQYAAVIAQRIIDSINSPFHLSGQECSIGVSIGISLYPLNSDNVETLLKYADIAMYRAKEDSGSSFQFYTPEMGSKVTETTDNEG